jgi:hypothetical protein
VKRTRLAGRDFAFATLVIDAAVLVGEARIHFRTTRVSLIPSLGVCKFRGPCHDAERKDCDCNARWGNGPGRVKAGKGSRPSN